MGAATALVLAGTYPDRVGAILLEDPPAWWVTSSSPELAAERQAQMRGWIIELKRKTREEMIADVRAQSPSWPEAELGPWADAKLRFSFNALNRLGAVTIDWQATLRHITCPALLIRANPEQGAIVTEESARGIQGLVPQLRIAHIPGAGHNIRREQFDRYIDVVRTFLAEVTACLS